MSDDRDRDAVVPRDVLERHLSDVPEPERRAQLSSLLRGVDSPPQPASSEVPVVDARDVEASPRTSTAPLSRTASRRFTLAAAAAAITLASWATWRVTSRRATEVSREPVAVASAPTPVLHRPCATARGTDGTLWHSGLDSPVAPSLDGRQGMWLHSWDGKAPGDPRPAEVQPSDRPGVSLLRAAGPSVSGWGAKLGVALKGRPGQAEQSAILDCYDASVYEGIRLRARGTGIVFVLLQTPDTVPRDLGGECTDKCWFANSYAISLNDAPQDYFIEWSRFARDTDTRGVQSRLMMIELFFQNQAEPYEIEVEEISLARRGVRPAP